jgi:hypothetical protein
MPSALTSLSPGCCKLLLPAGKVCKQIACVPFTCRAVSLLLHVAGSTRAGVVPYHVMVTVPNTLIALLAALTNRAQRCTSEHAGATCCYK